MTSPLWTPGEARISQTRLRAFSSWVSSRTGKPLTDYDNLHRWSVESPAEFWSLLWDFTEISGEKGAAPLLSEPDRMPGAQFFPSARLNFAENLLKTAGGADAIVFWGEDKVKRRLSRDELRAEVARAAKALREAGVGVGDRVAAMLPNMP